MATRDRLLSDCFGNSDRESLQLSDINAMDLHSTRKLSNLLKNASSNQLSDEAGFMTANNYDDSGATD